MDIDYDYLGQTIENAIANGMQNGAQMAFGEHGVSPVVTVNMPPILDLRDFFAGCALVGILGAEAGRSKITLPDGQTRQEFCYDQADQMLLAKIGQANA